jgi:hypothetical protein
MNAVAAAAAAVVVAAAALEKAKNLKKDAQHIVCLTRFTKTS